MSIDKGGGVLKLFCLVGGKCMSWGKGLPGGDWEIGGNFEVSLDTSEFCDLLKLPQFTYIKTFT